MRPSQSSATAEHNAILRAHESMRPEHERIIYDPYAAFFLHDGYLPETRLIERIEQAVARWEERYPGVCNSVLARTRFIDECLEEALLDGIRQLVILGAGYDTRALRFEALKKRVTVFELDHPATQKTKLERIKNIAGTSLPDVRYISIDFHSEPLDEKLPRYGYDDQAKTFFIWEGVTYYIPASVADHTLQFVAGHACYGSTIAFDYFPPSVACGTTALTEARALSEGLKELDEEIVFGIDPNRMVDFMNHRGFKILKHLSSEQCRQAYFQHSKGNREVSGMFTFVQAQVAT